MRKMILILGILVVFVNSCKRDPCEDGEPSAINYNEKLRIKLLTDSNDCIFANSYNIDSLYIKENNILVNHEYDDVNCEIIIESNIYNPVNITNNFNTILFSQIILQYDYQTTDTLIVEAKPVIFPELCNKNYYEYSIIWYNSKEIIYRTGWNCFACETLIINRD